MLEMWGVLRIYHMVVEVFGGRQCVTVNMRKDQLRRW